MQGEKSDKRVSLEEIADELGVSISTVSRVLNNKPGISDKVRMAATQLLEQYGYSKREVSGAKKQRLKSVAFAVSERLLEQINSGNSFYGRHLISVQNAVTKAGLYPLLVDTKSDLNSSGFLRCVEEMRVQAVIGEAWTEQMINAHFAEVPVVLLNMEDPSCKVDSITTNVEYAARQQLDYLYELGHRNIACFRLNVERCSWEDRRYWKEYYSFCHFKGLGLSGEYFESVDFEKDGHQKAIHQFLNKVLKAPKKATAVVTHDAYAPFFVSDLAARGLRVPQDFSVMGYNDIIDFWSECPVTISSFRQDFENMAHEAVRLLQSRLKDPLMPARLVQMGGKTIPRQSTGSIQKGTTKER